MQIKPAAISLGRPVSRNPIESPKKPNPEAKVGFQSQVPSRIAALRPAEVEAVRERFSHLEQVPGEILVGVNSGSLKSSSSELAAEYGAQVLETFKLDDSQSILRLKLAPSIESAEAIAAMASDSRVSFAEPDAVFTAEELFGPQLRDSIPQEPQAADNRDAPNDLDQRLWGLHNKGQTEGTPGADVKALEAWKVTKGDNSANGPLIAVIDTGIDYNHPDLAANMWRNPGEIPGDGIDNDGNGVVDDVYGYNAADQHGDPMDRHSHGTHCAGTIAAVGDNGLGVTGVMQKARLMAVKILDGAERTNASTIVRGILYAKNQGADITSNSWGMFAYIHAIEKAFESTPAIHLAAAGNANADNERANIFPANFPLPNIVSVAATDHKDQKSEFSSFGKSKVDVAAPGTDIFSTVLGGNYGIKSGTSMATPHAAGGAGLILSAFPELTVQEVKDRLIYGSDRLPALQDVSVSDGRVNFARSLEDDKVAPGAPHDFKPALVTARSATLSWTAVGDDKWDCGAAQTVEILRSSEAITPENASSAVAETLAGAEAVGALAHYTYSQAPKMEAETLHFAMRSIDNVGNKSELRSTSVTLPAAQAFYAENFEDGLGTGFRATGDFQVHAFRGRGMVYGTNPSRETGAVVDSSLTFPEIDLSQEKGAYLRLRTRTNVDPRASGAFLRVSADGGETWEQLHKYKNFQEWTPQAFDLTAYDGKKIQLKVDVGVYPGSKAQGFSVDDIQLVTEPKA